MLLDIPLAAPKHVDKGVLRLDLGSLMQQVLKEVLEGVVDEVFDEVHSKEVLERVIVTTRREELEEVPKEVDLLLLHPLDGNQEEEKEEEELGKEGAVKDRKKEERTFFSPIRLLLVKLPVIVMLSCSVQIMLIE